MEDEYCDSYNKTKRFPKHIVKIPGYRHLLNPGNIENLHKKTSDIKPIWLEGVHIQWAPKIKTNSILLCDWLLSHGSPSGFRIGGQYNFKMTENMKSTPIIKADINPSTLSCNLSLLYYPLSNVRIEYKTQTEPYIKLYRSMDNDKFIDNCLTCEYIAKSSTTTFKTYNTKRKSGRCTLSYLKSLTSRMALGTELLYEWNDCLCSAQTAFAFRYCQETSGISATFSTKALDISYWCQIVPNIQFGTTFVVNNYKKHSIASIFYQYELKNTIIRTLLDSNWSIGFTYNQRINELYTNLGFNILLCIPTNKFICGVQYNFDYN